jgi:hypothetical protein
MFDPGAMGTLVIGLDNIRSQEAADARGLVRVPRPSRRRRPIRLVIAAILRRGADLFEPVRAPAR